MAARQLALIPSGGAGAEQDWKLDEHTRAVGRAGLARARQALARQALAPNPPPQRSAA